MDLERDEVDFKQVDSEEGKVTLFPSAPQPYIFEKEEYSKLERIFHLNQWDWNSMVIRQNWMNVVVSGMSSKFPLRIAPSLIIFGALRTGGPIPRPTSSTSTPCRTSHESSSIKVKSSICAFLVSDSGKSKINWCLELMISHFLAKAPQESRIWISG